MKTLQHLFMYEIRDIYSAEAQFLEALPHLAHAAYSSSLHRAFAEHYDETVMQIGRLEDIADALGFHLRSEPCYAAMGMIREIKGFLRYDPTPEVCDAGLIALAQRIEHYEIAAYGTARTYAFELGLPEVASMLQRTLEEESHANEHLNALAISSINPLALAR